MSKINDGGPAFPLKWTELGVGRQPVEITHGGMSLRDWLAGQALAALTSYNTIQDMQALAGASYQVADAMLAAREGGA